MFKFIKKIKIIKNNREKGMTLVIALTTMTLLLSVSLSISNIVLRQIKISSMNDKSKLAFFAADSAAECAVYYDTLFIASNDDPDLSINQDIQTAIFGEITKEEKIAKIKCGNQSILNVNSDIITGLGPEVVKTSFDIDYGETCANVIVTRTDFSTNILATGYNTNATAAGCDLSNVQSRRLVERGLTIKY